jgi:hypothetical protein
MSQNIKGSTDAPNKYRDQNLTNIAVTAYTGTSEMVGWKIYNSNNADAFVHFCDTNSSGTTIVGTTAVVFTLYVPANSQIVEATPLLRSHHYFANGITLYATTAYADTDTTAPTTGLQIQIYYKTS